MPQGSLWLIHIDGLEAIAVAVEAPVRREVGWERCHDGCMYDLRGVRQQQLAMCLLRRDVLVLEAFEVREVLQKRI